MRSALSLSLVLLATMCGQAASASEYSAAQPLRLLLSACSSQHVEAGNIDSFGFTFDQPAVTAAELRVSPTHSRSLELSAEPASRSYERAAVAGLPSRGP